MLNLEPNKVYTLQISFQDSAATMTETVIGSKVETAVKDAKNKYPTYKRIVVYDADTGDVVTWIKK